MREVWPAPERNKEPLARALTEVLPSHGLVLEVASGSGQHVAHFATTFPQLEFQPSDLSDENFESVKAWCADLVNVRPPVSVDAAAPKTWPDVNPDVIFCANMIHIAPWSACLGLVAGAGAVLPVGGLLVLYGPFFADFVATAPSNLDFDASLRQRNPEWGVRQLSEVEAAADALVRTSFVPMPANNFVVVFERQG